MEKLIQMVVRQKCDCRIGFYIGGNRRWGRLWNGCNVARRPMSDNTCKKENKAQRTSDQYK